MAVVSGGSGKLAKIKPRETVSGIPVDSSSAHSSSHSTAYTASQSSPYLLRASASVNNSSGIVCQPSTMVVAMSPGISVGSSNIVCQPAALKSPGNVAAAAVQRSQPSYLVLGNIVGNSVGNSAGGFRLMSPGGTCGTPKSSAVSILSNSVILVNHPSTSSNSVVSSVETSTRSFVCNSPAGGCQRRISLGADHTSSSVPVVSRSVVLVNSSSALSPKSVSSVAVPPSFLAMSGRGSASGLVLHAAGVQPSPSVMATFLLPTAPLVNQNVSKPSSSVQSLLPAPVMQPVSLQSPTNSQLNFPQSSPMGNLQANPVWSTASPVGNTKMAFVGQSSASSKSQTIVVQSPLGNSQLQSGNSNLGNSPSAVVRQSSSDSILAGKSGLSGGIAGIPASTVVQTLLVGNSQQSGMAQQQSPMYYVVLGNPQSQSSGVQMSSLPQIVLLGQTAAVHQQPQLSLSSPAFITTTQ